MESIASGTPRRKARAAALVLTLAIAVPMLTRTAAADDEPEPVADESHSSEELERLKARIAEIDRDMEAAKGQQDALRDELEATEAAIAQAAAAAQAAAQEVSEQKHRVELAERGRAQAETAVADERRRLAAALRAFYVADAPTRLQAVFAAERLAAVDRLEAETSAVTGAIAGRVRTVREDLERLKVAAGHLREQMLGLDDRRRTQESALSRLKTAQGARRKAVDAIARRLANRATERVEAEQEQARIEKLLDSLRRTLRDSPEMKFESGVPFRSLRGHLPWPLKGRILANFGDSKGGGGRLTWNGWWIGADEGETVRAVADARVVYVGQIQRYGVVIILDHSGDYLSLYGHLQSARAEVGQVVKAGDPIALAGDSGGHEQPGLYFEIRQGTSPVDPRGWLAP